MQKAHFAAGEPFGFFKAVGQQLLFIEVVGFFGKADQSQAAFGLPQIGFLVFASFGNVEVGAIQLDRVTVGAGFNHLATATHPAPVAIFCTHAELDLKHVNVTSELFVDPVQRGIAVIRMHVRHPLFG